MQLYIYSLILTILFLVSLSVEAAQSCWIDLRQEFDDIRFSSANEASLLRLEGLLRVLEVESRNNPDLDFLALYGVVLVYQAERIGGIQALDIAAHAKNVLEKTIKMKSNVLAGYAMATLGILYESMPSWPLSFGDRKKGSRLLDAAYDCCKNNIDVSFLYGKHLVNIHHWELAVQVLRKATEIDQLSVNSKLGFMNGVVEVTEMMKSTIEKKNKYAQDTKITFNTSSQ